LRSAALPVALTALGAVLYVIAEPHAADLAAASFRSDLFAREGFTVFNTAWYGGHHTPGYSVLAPALGALLGERVLAGLSAIAATAAFAALAGRTAGLLFVPGILASVASGRIAFTLGAALGVAAVLAATRGRTLLTALAAALSALASPVAAMFLAVVAAAFLLPVKQKGTGHFTLGGRVTSREGDGSAALRGRVTSREGDGSAALRDALVLGLAALVPAAFLGLAFPEQGTFPFVPSAFWPAFAAAVGVAVVAPRGPLKAGAALYALLLAVAFLVDSPVGGNAVRLGTLTAAPVAFALLWPRRRAALAVLALPLAYWVLQPAVRDVLRTQGDPSTAASYHRPLVDWLRERQPARVEIPLTQNHGEAEHVAREVPIARGWLRQADLERNPLFYEPGPLSPLDYERWLRENAIAYVALPEGLPLDRSGEEEQAVIVRGPAFLRPVARRGRWRIFAVRDPQPLATPPARVTAIEPEGFRLRFAEAGATTVRVRHTRYFSVVRGRACVGETVGGWTRVRSDSEGVVEVRARFALGSVVRPQRDCAPG
jgi:hypothetical protein